MSTVIVGEYGKAQIPAPSANLPCGKFINDTALGACVVEGLNAAARASGDPITVTYAGVVKVPSASATTFAKDANVQINTSTDLAVASGTFHIGRALFAKTSGQLEVYVVLNKAASGG